MVEVRSSLYCFYTYKIIIIKRSLVSKDLNTYVHQKTCIGNFIAALFIIAKTCK